MSTLLSRKWAVAIIVAALFVVAVIGVTGRSVPAQASEPLPVEVAEQFRVPLPEEVVAAMERRAAVGPVADSAPDGPAAPAQDVIASEGFEGDTFPPEGWEVVDRIAGQAGQEDQWTWGRQTCEVPSTGGTAAAWGVGGGAQGSQLPCWTAYSEPVDGLLVYPGIDTTGYAGGVSVTFVFKPDIPRNNAFQICWAPSPEEQATCRSYNVPPEQQNRWLVPQDTVLPDSAGHSDLVVFFRYLDEEPTGASRGAIVDNVLIEGLLEEPTPVPTTAPTNTRPPTQPPQPTNTPRTGIDIFMPFSLKRFDTVNLPTVEPPPPWSVVANLGTVNDEGEFEPGTRYQLGLMGMCLQVDWEGLEIGSQIRWQWFVNDEAVAPDDTNLNRTIETQQEDGWFRSCIQYSNQETGELLPLPEATYRVDVWALNVAPGAPVHDSAEAVIGSEGTPPPVVPTATPTLDPGQYDCRDVITNGGFESGPDEGWEVVGNFTVQGQPVQLSDIIVRYEDAGISGIGEEYGDWFGFFRFIGSDFDIITELRQLDSVPEVPSEQVASAQLDYWAGILTEEVPNGEATDRMGAFFISSIGADGTVEGQPIAGSLISEENREGGRYYRFTIDVTDMVKQRADEGWPLMRLGYQATQNTEAATQFLLDRVSLNLCTERSAAAASNPGVRRSGDVPASSFGVFPAERITGGSGYSLGGVESSHAGAAKLSRDVLESSGSR